MADPGTFTTVLQTIEQITGDGYHIMYRETTWIFDRLLVLAITLTGISWAFGAGRIYEEMFKMLMKVGFIYLLISEYSEISQAIVDSLIRLGILSGNAAVPPSLVPNATVLEQPSQIIELGFQVTEPILGWIHKVSFYDFAKNIFEVIVAGLCALIIIFCFFWLALQVFIALAEFYISTNYSILLLGFAALKQTSWMAEGAIKAPVMYGLKLSVLALLITFAMPILQDLRVSNNPTFSEMSAVTLAVVLYTTLVQKAGSIASGIISGSPSLGASDLVQGATTSAAVAATGVAASAAGVKAASAGVTQGAKVASAAKQGGQMGHALSTKDSSAGKAVDGAMGAIKGGAGKIAQSAKEAGVNLTKGMRDAGADGRLKGYEGTGGKATNGMKNNHNSSETSSSSFAGQTKKAVSASSMVSRLSPRDSGNFQSGKIQGL